MPPAPFSSRPMTAADWPAIKHFHPSEFHHPEHMGYEFMLWLDQVREQAGVPMTITSDYRTEAHNKEVGGANDSAHCDTVCNAVDIGMRPNGDDPNWNYSRFMIVTAALALGCQRFGLYADGSVHLDRTEQHRPAPRMWRIVDHPAH